MHAGNVREVAAFVKFPNNASVETKNPSQHGPISKGCARFAIRFRLIPKILRCHGAMSNDPRAPHI
jgi:hypothetical protein